MQRSRSRTRKTFEKPLTGDQIIRREDIVQLIGEVLAGATSVDKRHVEDRVNQRLMSSKTRTRKINQLAPETPGANRYKVSKVAVWAAREWPTLDFSKVFAALEPATAMVTVTLGAATLSAAARLVPQDYESCKAALIEAWAKIDELQAR